ncbi:MAG: Gfo/Idh/MocA family protein [Pseudoclavibacter sp.]
MTTRAVVVAAGSHIFQAAHLPGLDEAGIEVVAAFDVDENRVRPLAEARGWRLAHDLDDLLGTEAELAIVCAPHPLHADIVIRCLDAGYHVVVEKPIAVRLGEIDDIAAAQTRTGLVVAVVHQHRLRAETIAARAIVGEGAIGRIHRVIASGSFPKRSTYYTDTPWRGTWRGEGGGVLLNQGLHTVDLLVHLLGEPARVAASLRTAVHPIETEDTADVTIAWPSGAVGTLHITSAAAVDDERIEIYGSAGALRLDGDGLAVRIGADADEFARAPGGHFDAFEVPAWRPHTSHGGGSHTDVYRDLLCAIGNGGAPITTVDDARHAVEVIAAASIASASGNWVPLPLAASMWDRELDTRINAETAADHHQKGHE